VFLASSGYAALGGRIFQVLTKMAEQIVFSIGLAHTLKLLGGASGGFLARRQRQRIWRHSSSLISQQEGKPDPSYLDVV
jgi:hypothetical protein